METSKEYWEKYYAQNREPAPPSKFAEFILPFLQTDKLLIELGCGNAKDSIFFSQNGINVLAIDQCKEELDFLTERFKDLPTLNFLPGDMTNLTNTPNPDYLYSRFTLHAIDLDGEKKVLKWAFDNLKSSGIFFIEVRSVNDDLYGVGTQLPDNAYFSDHYRRFEVIDELEQRLKDVGFNILYKQEAKGLAPFKERDPSIIRILAMK